MKYVAILLGVALSTSPVWAQAMLDRAAVAAGGGIGVASGKKVSDGMTAIFGKVDGQTKAAAKADAKGDKGKKKVEPDEPMLKLGTPQMVGAGHADVAKDGRIPAALGPKTASRRAAAGSPQHVASSGFIEATVPLPPVAPPTPVIAIVLAPPPPPPVPEIVATREILAAIPVGATRQDVLAKLGTPSSRISMYEDGEAVEILRFQSKRSSVGAVRMVNNAVTEVMVVEN